MQFVDVAVRPQHNRTEWELSSKQINAIQYYEKILDCFRQSIFTTPYEVRHKYPNSTNREQKAEIKVKVSSNRVNDF